MTLDTFRQPVEVLGEDIHYYFFILGAAADMKENLMSRVGAEHGQDCVVIDQIGDGALHDVLPR